MMNNERDGIEWIEGGGVVSPQGFAAGAARAGIKTEGDDLALVVSERPATAAAVFTRNRVKAAPVLVCAEHAAHPMARAIVANSGNANCCTGAQGLQDAHRLCELAAQRIGCDAREVLVCSTGIIGHPLPMEKIESAIAAIEMQSDTANEAAARAVMTTDTRPKFCAARTTIGGAAVTVGGQAKGVGMIGPDMGQIERGTRNAERGMENEGAAPHATMLAFLTTDAALEKPLLQRALEESVARSFNSVTVDGDTSTNDTCLLLANGASGVAVGEAELEPFRALLDAVCVRLARKIARDGEGATRLVTVEVRGAESEADARRIALTVANSPLVKTAIFGRDPNWGRIAMAAGRAGVDFDPAKLGIRLGDVEVFRGGEPLAFDVAQAEAAMSRAELTIGVALGEGSASWTAWTCDFSYDYVRINAEYHT